MVFPLIPFNGREAVSYNASSCLEWMCGVQPLWTFTLFFLNISSYRDLEQSRNNKRLTWRSTHHPPSLLFPSSPLTPSPLLFRGSLLIMHCNVHSSSISKIFESDTDRYQWCCFFTYPRHYNTSSTKKTAMSSNTGSQAMNATYENIDCNFLFPKVPPHYITRSWASGSHENCASPN